MTVDEELTVLDDTMRRLKVEYDVYFGGGSRKPPVELDWRVQGLLKKYSDSQKLTFTQRFKYNSIAQRYAIFSELWRQKLRIREEGYRRPEDALLSIQGLRTDEERAAARALKARSTETASASRSEFVVDAANVEDDTGTVRSLFEAMLEAKRLAGEASPSGRFEGFLAFIKLKTDQIRRDYGCQRVEYRVELRDRKVRLTAKPKR
ncbi:MAG: MXAN_5187 C-terminal domain-containing protein [Terriglobales bacterium]